MAADEIRRIGDVLRTAPASEGRDSLLDELDAYVQAPLVMVP